MAETDTASPRCPHCGYDQSGLIRTWTDRCPLEATCPECGRASPSVSLFVREMLGPSWSLEHASRRFVRKWVATTAVALRPAKLWKELRPDHPVFRGRLAVMAVSWVLVLHLLCAAMLGLSWLALIVSGSASANPWYPAQLREWWFWKPVLTRLAWPYRGWIEVPVASNMTVGDPLYAFVEMTALPMLMMGAMTGLWLHWPRSRRLGARHIQRAVVLMLPGVAAWTVISVLAFAVMGQWDTPTSTSPVPQVLFLCLVVGFVANMTWWWRCFAVRYAGRQKGVWSLLPLGLLALFMGWASAVMVDELLSWY